MFRNDSYQGRISQSAEKYSKTNFLILFLELQLIDPVCLRPFPSNGLNPLVEQVVVLPYPGKLAARVTACSCNPEGFEIQEGLNPRRWKALRTANKANRKVLICLE